ncbi:hypothetical protein BCV69DRAFT_311853 [Microstroma glucosiphilum]|uniref:Myosin-binding domain-containing protein n=1 Tax=Pseudomicrostroma glucosiphilum TaxID=1684307 RepID=A0A316UA94_9BASI|nr:hypothetical protein BCV69DRAFT_311853 [Pseudomicrostroma glucosiphilum]PWN21333.1 hypothetical protein BCV69DRAFT_311853 [Pseudomicrostroma glucosiphilum]
MMRSGSGQVSSAESEDAHNRQAAMAPISGAALLEMPPGRTSKPLSPTPHTVGDRERCSSIASASSARTVSQSPITSRSDSSLMRISPSSSSPSSLRPARSPRSSPGTDRRPSRPLTLSEELGEGEDYVGYYSSPRGSIVSTDSRSPSPEAKRKRRSERRVEGGNGKGRHRRASATVGATIVISTGGASSPSESPMRSLLFDGAARSSEYFNEADDASPKFKPSRKLAPEVQPTAPLRQASLAICQGAASHVLHWLKRFMLDFQRALLLITRELWESLVHVLPNHLQESHRTTQASTVVPSTQFRCALPQFRTPTANNYAEKFKYVICTSFLLTSSLSISLYDSSRAAPTRPTAADEVDREDAQYVMECLPKSERTQHKRVTVNTFSGRIIQDFSSASGLVTDPDTGFGRQIRNATIIASALLWLFSPSAGAWGRTVLLMTALSWSTAVVLAHYATSSGETVTFEVTNHGGGVPSFALRSAIERRRTCAKLLAAADRTVKSSQEADVQFNKTLTAIQEVELVARGFKITHPLPPISRIEAADKANQIASPVRRRGSLYTAGASSSERMGRSYSMSGATGEPAKRQAQPEMRRMSRLRQGLLEGLEGARQACRILLAGLEPLAEVEELSSLREVYSLSDPTIDGPHPGEQAGSPRSPPRSDAESRRGSMLLPLLTGTVALEDSAYTSEAMVPNGSKRSSWGPVSASRMNGGLASAPARYGLGSATTGSAEESFNDSIASSDSPQSVRYSSQAEGGSISLSRTGSLLRRRRGSHFEGENGWSGSEPASETVPPGTVPEPRSGRGSRLSYIVEGVDAAGPNESPISKRLSYQSTESRPESRLSASAMSDRRDSIGNSTRLLASPQSMLDGTAPWQSPLRHQSSSRRNGSLRGVGVSPIAPRPPSSLAGSLLGQVEEPQQPLSPPEDPLSLLSLRQAFEDMHSLRRHALCHLLALKFASLSLFSARDYWQQVESLMRDFAEALDGIRKRMSVLLDQELNGDKQNGVTSQLPRQSEARLPTESAVLPGSTGLVPFTGFEDRSQALASAIRSIQVKLRACAEELAMAHPPALHGPSVSFAPFSAKDVSTITESEAGTRKENAERIWDSLKDDIMSITQEWEGGSKILRMEKRRGEAALAAGARSSTGWNGHVEGAGALGLSQIETSLAEGEEENATTFKDVPYLLGPTSTERSLLTSDSDASTSAPISTSGLSPGSPSLPTSSSASEDLDLVSLLLQSTSPGHLPPPGLEEVFESITGIAGSLDAENSRGGGAKGKMSREERIRAVKEQREEAKRAQNAMLESETGGGGLRAQAGVVTELKDVLDQLRQRREAGAAAAGERQQQPAQPLQHSGEAGAPGGAMRRGVVESESGAGIAF